MKIKIGSVLYLGGDSNYKLKSPISGLRSPDIRNGDIDVFGRDGGFINEQFYGDRIITMNGFFIGKSCEDAISLRKTLLSLLRIRYKQSIVIMLDNGDNYYIEGHIKTIKCPISSPLASEYQISLLCPSPFFYLLNGGTSSANTWSTETLSSGASASINNDGDIEDYPTITCTGIFDNISIINGTTDKKIALRLATTQADDKVIIDMERQIISLNDETINSMRTTDSSWWVLAPGENIISVGTGSGSPTVTLQHRTRKVGI